MVQSIERKTTDEWNLYCAGSPAAGESVQVVDVNSLMEVSFCQFYSQQLTLVLYVEENTEKNYT